MSTDSDDNDTEDTTGATYRGPKLRTNAHGVGGSHGFSRSLLGPQYRGHSLDSQSVRLYDAFNYPEENELNFHTWLSYYYREGPIAGVVDKLVRDTWQGGAPGVTDDDPASGESDQEDTDFEQAVEKLFSHDNGLNLRAPVLDRLIAADILATLGQYSIVVFGFEDDADTAKPLEENTLDSTDDLNGLAYMEVYAEDDVTFDLVDDLDNDRHGRPETYHADGHEVHHSRVIHVAENTLVDPYYGIPFFKPIVNLIVNIQKILGASGEGYFRGGHPAIVFQPPDTMKNFGSETNPQIKRAPGTFAGKDSELTNKIENSISRYKRAMTANGSIETLSPNVASPADHMAEQWAAVAAAKDLPQSIIKGNETGERATAEDSASLRRRIAGRRSQYAEGRLYRPCIDILSYAGVLPDPQGDGYEVDWPPLSEPTDQEEADLNKTQAQTAAEGGKMFGTPPTTVAEFRKRFLDMDPERGSEAPDAVAEQDGRSPAELDAAMGMGPQGEQDEPEPLRVAVDGGDSTTDSTTDSTWTAEDGGTGLPDNDGEADG